VTSVVIGARTDAQLKDYLKAVGLVLTPEERGGSTPLARRHCSTPTGTKQARRSIGSRQQTSRYSVHISNTEPKRTASVELLKQEGKFAREANVVPR
jgi:hypothetical protein